MVDTEMCTKIISKLNEIKKNIFFVLQFLFFLKNSKKILKNNNNNKLI